MTRLHRSRSWTLWWLAATVAAPAAWAETGYQVTAGVGRSDNILRDAENEQSDTVGTVGLELSLARKRDRFQADVAADLDYLSYVDHTFDDEVVGNFIGSARATLVPQHIQWVFADNFGQGLIDPLASDSPSNREDINYFNTGPDFAVGIGSQTRLLFSGRYSKVDYSENPYDNQRFGGTVGLMRELSTASRISLNAQAQRVRFDDIPDTADFDREDAYLHYETLGRRTQIQTDLGVTRLKQSQGHSNGSLAHLQVSRQISASSIVAAAFGYEFSDASSSFLLLQNLGGTQAGTLGTQAIAQTSNPFTNAYGTLGWNFRRHRTSWGVEIAHFSESYRNLHELDRQRLRGSLRIQRDLTPALTATLQGSYLRENYENIAADSRDTAQSAALDWRLGRRLSLSLQVDHYHRSGELPENRFTENRAWLKLGFGKRITGTGPATPLLPVNTPPSD